MTDPPSRRPRAHRSEWRSREADEEAAPTSPAPAETPAGPPRAGDRPRASFWRQSVALGKLSWHLQRRNWLTNAVLILTPVFFTVLLFVLQKLINAQLDTRDNRCGCACVSCCDWVTREDGVRAWQCFESGAGGNVCTPYSECRAWDDARCGPQYSTYSQILYCAIENPPSFPPIVDVPPEGSRSSAHAGEGSAALLYTGDNMTLADGIAENLLARRLGLNIAILSALSTLRRAGAGAGSNTTEEDATRISSAFQGLDDTLELTLGTSADASYSYLLDPAFEGNIEGTSEQGGGAFSDPKPVYYLLPDCEGLSEQDANALELLGTLFVNATGQRLVCVSAPAVWRYSPEDINSEVYCGWRKSGCVSVNGTIYDVGASDHLDHELRKSGPVVRDRATREKALLRNAQGARELPSALFDFRASNETFLDLTIWYNNSDVGDQANNFASGPPKLQRVSAPMNMAANAYLRHLKGSTRYSARLRSIRSMPKTESSLRLDFSTLLGTLFYMWLAQMLLPVQVYRVVYEKKQRLRAMMRMQGLGDMPYFFVNYGWNMLMYTAYTLVFVLFGSVIGLAFFTENDYLIQAVFYFLFGNVMVVSAFGMATSYESPRTALVATFLSVFGSGLIANILFAEFVNTNPDGWLVIFLEASVPPFALYRGLYELSQYAFRATNQGVDGMTWSSLGDDGNGMLVVWIIWAVEIPVWALFALYHDQVLDTGNGACQHPLFWLRYLPGPIKKWGYLPPDAWPTEAPWAAYFRKMSAPSLSPGKEVGGEDAPPPLARDDVAAEEAYVETIVAAGAFAGGPGSAAAGPSTGGGRRPPAVVLQDLRKVYPGQDSNGQKIAVEKLSLAVGQAECFGLLGPNGAGKSTAINMMVGFLAPTSGQVLVHGYDVLTERGRVYPLMGVCPQHDLLWGSLTAREHLEFYGRVKNLRARELADAVEEALKSVSLSAAADTLTGAFSGGMKRRLSVAIAMIGDPLVVYLDEPSTGLDPASRRKLWEVVKHARSRRAVLLTTHSMEEAEVLSDRIGIFVNGNLQCLGSPMELVARHGGYVTLTLTTPPGEAAAAARFISRLAAGATLTYSLGGTQKFEIPSEDMRLEELPRIFKSISAMAAAARAEDGRAREAITILCAPATTVDWGIAHATLEEVFIKVSKLSGAGMRTFN